jgi:hypothetical protein
MAAALCLRSEKIESLEEEFDYLTIDPITKPIDFENLYISVFCSDYSISQDFYKNFINKCAATNELRSYFYFFILYNVNCQFERYIYNIDENFDPIYSFYVEEQIKLFLVSIFDFREVQKISKKKRKPSFLGRLYKHYVEDEETYESSSFFLKYLKKYLKESFY